MFTKVKSLNKGIARAPSTELCVPNQYHKECSCTIDFLINNLFNPVVIPYVSQLCHHCKKLKLLIDRLTNGEFEDEEIESEEIPEYLLDSIPFSREPETALNQMLQYARELNNPTMFFTEEEDHDGL